MNSLKRVTAIFLLLYSFSLQALEGCPDFLVKLWTRFSQCHGIDTVPAFLIKNNCIAGPNSIVENYEKQERLLNQNNITKDYFLGAVDASSEDNSLVQSSIKLVSDENQTVTTDSFETDNEIPFRQWDLDSNQYKLLNNTELETEPPLNIGADEPTFVQLIFIKVQNNKVNYYLLLTLLLILTLILFKYYKKYKVFAAPLPDKTCPDCGTNVKGGVRQCFICGSYV